MEYTYLLVGQYLKENKETKEYQVVFTNTSTNTNYITNFNTLGEAKRYARKEIHKVMPWVKVSVAKNNKTLYNVETRGFDKPEFVKVRDK